MLDTGSVLKQRYLIEKHLGKGGMGSVYLGTDQTFGSKVAIKETIVQGEGLEEAFEREAQVLNRVRHGAIPVVIDYFIEGGGQFLVMQYIPGDDLSVLISRAKKPFPQDKVLEWADKLLDALTYLHTQEPPIIHRDIKPQNLKLTDRGEIVLLDFGLSKAASGKNPVGVSLFGYTMNYAPIEQVQSEGTDARSDIFSLAATLYHLLTGVKPLDVVKRLTAEPSAFKPIHELAPGVSRQVSDIIMSALAIRREDRPESAAAFRMALRGAAFDDLLSLAHGFEDDSASRGSAPVGVAAVVPHVQTIDSELPTVVTAANMDVSNPTLVGPPSDQSMRSADPTVSGRTDDHVFELPTVVTPNALDALRPAPQSIPASVSRPVEKNRSNPSTVKFVFETVTLAADGTVESREKRVARRYFEGAGGGESVALIEIPSGEFSMGSPDDELEREGSEGPTVNVSVGAYFIGHSPVTQAQWRSVATHLPRVGIDLNPEPSHFKDDARPVETVSWEEATEFCERLSAHTGRDYRLPSEAEWEYACRAGTSTPFCYGPTLTVDVANVEGAIEYGDGPTGNGRSETTKVGTVGPHNQFGLVDVHGNVWEWAADQWHDTFDGAPTNATSWIEGGDPTVRVLRGGSWTSIPADARSAKRFSFHQKGRRNDVGFRIVLSKGSRQ